MANAVDALIDALAATLATVSVNGVALTVKKEWPAANEKLSYPSLTLFQQTPKFSPRAVLTEVARTYADGTQIASSISYACGDWDLRMQLDLWCRNKFERKAFFEAVHRTLNPQLEPMGLSLQLTNYFNQWVRYDLIDYQFLDDETGIERQEWRVRINLLANCTEVLTRTDYAIKTVDITVETPDNIP